MIASTPPTIPSQNINLAAEVQYASPAIDSDYRQVVKEIYLRRLVDGTIKENEKQHVVTGVNIVDLNDGRTIVSHNENTEQFAASINKLPVALLLLEDLRRDKTDINQTVTWTADDRRGGFGELDKPDAPLQAPLRDVIYDMLHSSGNTALRVSVNQVLGGPQAVNDRWATKPQLAHTRLQLLDPTHFYLGNSTPHDSLWAIRQLMAHPDKYSQFMKDAMHDNIFTDFGVRSQLPDTDFVLLVNKIGLLDDVEGNNRHDVGIVYNTKTHKSYGYSFMTTAPYSTEDVSPTVQADESLKDMGGALLKFAGGKGSQNKTSAAVRDLIEKRMYY
jgi:beta-lactamase class A